MMKPRALLIVGLLFGAPPAFAEPISFESGDLTGWMATGSVSVQGLVTLPPEFGTFPVAPTDGLYQALLGSDGVTAAEMEAFFGMSIGTLTSQSFFRGSGMKRDFTLGTGDAVSFDWNFIAGDFAPPLANDAALFISNGSGTLLSSVALVGDFNQTGYQPYSFTASAGGIYSLGVAVFDRPDDFNPSFLTVDNFNIIPESPLPPPVSVPEPSTLLMLTGGFAAVLAKRYRMN